MSRIKKTCPCCGLRNVGPIKTWRRITAFADKAQNELRCCVHCIREDDLYYAERWSDYFSDQGFYQPIRTFLPVRSGRRPPIPRMTRRSPRIEDLI